MTKERTSTMYTAHVPFFCFLPLLLILARNMGRISDESLTRYETSTGCNGPRRQPRPGAPARTQ